MCVDVCGLAMKGKKVVSTAAQVILEAKAVQRASTREGYDWVFLPRRKLSSHNLH